MSPARVRNLPALVFASSIFVTACSGPAPEAPPWVGSWEGFVETTNQTVFILLEIDGEPTATGRVTLVGNTIPAEELVAVGDSLRFAVQLGPQRVTFAGTRAGEDVEGDALALLEGQDEEAARFTFELGRIPEFEASGSRREAWQQDLAHARDRFLRYDRSYAPSDRARAVDLLDELEEGLDQMEDSEVLVGLARVAALADNAHTRMYLLRNRTVLRRIPLRFWWFEDGLFVIGAPEAFRGTLGCRVASVAGVAAREARDSVSTLFAANESWRDYKSTYFLTAPLVLHGLGMSQDSTAIPLELECAAGAVAVTVEAAPLLRLDTPVENWRNLSPVHGGEGELLGAMNGAWTPALDETTPLYVSQPGVHYWSQRLADGNTLYLQYNRSENTPDGPSLTDFGEGVLEALAEVPGDVVVDLRFNTGGDLGVASTFFDRLAEAVRPEHRLVALVGQSTFSAGLFHVAQLRLAGATLVGREPGDRLEYWSEGGNVILPNSGYTLHFANGYHSYSGNPDPGVDRIFQSLSVGSLEPDVPVRTTSADYFAGRDPLLEAALEVIGSS